MTTSAAALIRQYRDPAAPRRLTYAQIAARLGGDWTEDRLEWLAHKLGLTVPLVPWTEEDDQTLRRLHALGQYDRQIARRLGRTVTQAARRRRKLGLPPHPRRVWQTPSGPQNHRCVGMRLRLLSCPWPQAETDSEARMMSALADGWLTTAALAARLGITHQGAHLWKVLKSLRARGVIVSRQGPPSGRHGPAPCEYRLADNVQRRAISERA